MYRWQARRSALLLFLAWPLAVEAQQTGTVRGRVVELSSRRGIPEVQIVVVGTGAGAVTDREGLFTITAAPAGSRILRARRIGFSPADRTIEIAIGREVEVEFELATSATQLTELVVTGTAGLAERKTLGNSITQVNVAELSEKTTLLNVSEALQSKAPGVTFLPGSGAPGTAGELRIRGASSISGYRPVVFIDGIRYNIESMGNFAATGAGLAGLAQSSQVTSALDFLNPNDIESIEILKGPAAATLYGAEAANGVIQIITKKGARGQQRLQYGIRLERGEEEWFLRPPDNHTTCDQVKMALRDAQGVPVWPGCQGLTVNSVITDNPLFRDPLALRVGELARVSGSVRGGGDRYSFYLSGDRDSQQGVFFNSDLANKSVRSNFTFNPNEKSDFAVNVNWQQNRIRLPMQDESAASLLLSGSRGLPGRATFFPTIPNSEGWRTIAPARANGYKNGTEGERLTLGGTVNLVPVPWFRNRFTVGIDNTISQAQLLFLPGDDGEPAGANAQQNPIQRLLTLDYSASAVGRIRNDFEFTTSAGVQVVSNRRETLSGTGRGIGAPDVPLIGSAQTTSATESFSEVNSVGYYVQEQLGWKDRLYVTGAVRADDHSSFGTNFDVIIYPKLSASYVMSDEPRFRELLDRARVSSLKLRAAFGGAGRAPAPYSATQTYTVSVVTQGAGTGSAVRALAFGNPDLKAERGTEFEIGFDAGLVGERLGLDFTWYNRKTTDMLQSVAVAPSTGFPVSRLTNLGEVINRGVELGVNATPVDSRNVTWDTRLNYSSNHNELVSFGIPGRTTETPAGQAYGAVQQHRPGFPMGGYWAQFPLRNPDGSPRLTTSGALILDTATFVGQSTPAHEVGLSNTVTFFRVFRLYALLDFKGGFWMFNLKERNRCQTANDNCARVNDPRARFPQNAADSVLFRELAVWRGTPAPFIEPADFTKLREVSLTVTAPARLARRIRAQSANIVFSARNVALWSDYSGIDPEVNTYGGRNFVRVDAYSSPMNRRLTAGLNLTF
ncbi:MAG: SusC/RagA family TonB-linked outer membrane protein [Gemmatimonadota bacterium]